MSSSVMKFAGFEVKTFQEFKELCKDVSNSSLVPKHYSGKPNDIMVAYEYGSKLGLSFMQCLAGIYIVNGIPNVWGDTLLAVVMSHPDFEGLEESFDTTDSSATCVIKRKGFTPVISKFSKAQAIVAKLWGKDGPWSSHPDRMLKLKARNFALRDQFADVLKGMRIREEVIEYEIVEKDITPPDFYTPVPVSDYQESFNIRKLRAMVGFYSIPAESVNAWLAKEGKESLADLSDEFAQVLINGIVKKYGDVDDANIN